MVSSYDVRLFENKMEAELAEANFELAVKKAKWHQQAMVAEVEAAKSAAIREVELQMEVERKNALREAEKLKVEVQEANWEVWKKRKAADAMLYEQERAAEVRKELAKAARFAREQEADGELYAKRKEAEGLAALLQALGGNYANLRDYLMINGGMYARIGLQPEINVWTDGGSCEP